MNVDVWKTEIGIVAKTIGVEAELMEKVLEQIQLLVPLVQAPHRFPTSS